MNRIQHVKKFCTAEKEAVMLTEMGNNGYELCAKEGNAYYFKRAVEVKNLAQPDVLSSFPLGSKVRKIKGYKFDGTIVANFKTVAGKDRLVVDNGDGMLHIFNEEQLERVID